MFKISSADPKIVDKLRECELFDYYRLVDTDTYAVLDFHEGKLLELQERCYSVWKRGEPCLNCISRLAVAQQRQIVKLETTESQIFLVVSVPISLNERPLALELVKDVTNSLMVNDSKNRENIMFSSMIQKMNELTVRDGATGLYNRRFAEQKLEQMIRDWDGKTPLTVVVVDIDHFKQANDTYGHLAGDGVIDSIALLLKECAASGDGWAARMGGDEFVLLFSGLERERVQCRVKELCAAISAVEFVKERVRFHVSVSVGMAEYQKGLGEWKGLLDLADRRMYQNKRCKRQQKAQ